jgi:ketosteroid isomerase-like protein
MLLKSYHWIHDVRRPICRLRLITVTGEFTMSASRRSVLAAGIGFAAGGASRAQSSPSTDTEVAGLIKLSEDSNAALLRGDAETYLDMVRLSDDFSLMSPFGGAPSQGAMTDPARRAALGRFFKNGRLSVDLVQSYRSADMVVLALIERANIEVGGLPAQDWALRVTLVYRRDGAQWRLVHRHADPLVAGISLQKAAAIARGDER